MKNKNIFNKVSHQFLAIFLTAILLLTNISTSVIYAQDDEQPVESPETTQVVDTDETKQTSGGEKEASTPTPEVGEKTKTEEAPDGTNEVSVSDKLAHLDAQLPTLDEYKEILENCEIDESYAEKYEQVASVLEQMDEVAYEDESLLTQCERYVAITTYYGIETLAEDLTVSWADSNGDSLNKTTLDTVAYRETVYAYIYAKFPSDSTERVIQVLPNPSLYIVEDGTHSTNKSFTENVTIGTLDQSVSIKADPKITVDSYGNTRDYKTYNTGRTYTLTAAAPETSFSIQLRNSVGTNDDGYGMDNNRLWSNGATNGTGCLTVKLTYKDDQGTYHDEIVKTLNITKFEKAIPVIQEGNMSDYYTQSEPKLLLTTDTDICSSNLIYFKWKGQDNGSDVIKYTAIPMKSVKLTLKITDGLLLDLTNTSWEIAEDYKSNGDGTNTVVIQYKLGNAVENYNLPSSGGYIVFGYNPTVYFSDTIKALGSKANGKTFQLHVEQAEFIQYEDIKADGSLTEKTYKFTDETQTKDLGTCYYEIEDLQYPFVTRFIAETNHGVRNDHFGNEITDVSWYNDNYKDNIGVVSILNYGLYGTRDLTDATTIKMTFDNTYIGVKAVRLPMDREQANRILNGEENFSVSWKTNKNTTLQTKDLTDPNGYNNTTTGDNFSYIYVNSSDLGLASDEYITEIRYTVDQIIHTYGSTSAGNIYGTSGYAHGRNAYNYGWVLGKIINYQKGATYNCTIQLFKDAACTPGQELTGEGVVTSTLSDEKRVDLQVDSVTVNGRNPGQTLTIRAEDKLTMTSKICYKDLTNGYGNKDTEYTSRVLGYTPVTAIYIRDLFGTGIDNLTIQNTLTGNYLVEDGQAADGVTVSLDHTEEKSDANHQYQVNVYKVEINQSQLKNYLDCVVGHYVDTYLSDDRDSDNKITDNLVWAKLTVSWTTTVDKDFEKVGADDIPVLLSDVFDSSQSLYAEGDSNVQNVGDIKYLLHNNYTSIGAAYDHTVLHIDEFDVNKDGKTQYDSAYTQTGSQQGDSTIVRAQNGTQLQMPQPEKRSDMVIETSFKESDEGASAYRSYDGKNASTKESSTVNLASDDATMRVLVANFGTMDVSNFDLYVIIPKKGQKWGANTQLNPSGVTTGSGVNGGTPYNDVENGFAFSVNLTSPLSNPFENDPDYPMTVTYANITPGQTEDDITDQLSKFEAYNAANAANYNIIHVHADDLQDSTTTETALEQLSRTKYFTASITYGDEEYSEETQYDIWRCIAKYREKGGGTDITLWHETNEFGLRAVSEYVAEAIDKYVVSNSLSYLVSSTNDSDVEDTRFADVAEITTTKAIVSGKSVSAKLDITSPNFTLDKDGVYVTVTDDNGNVKTYNYTDENSKVKIVKVGETTGTTTGSSNLLKLNFVNKFNKLNTGVVVLNEPDTKTVYESYTITIDGSVVNGNVHFDTPIVGKAGSITGVNGGTETDNTGEGEANTKVKLPINDTDGLTTKVYTSDVKAESGKILPSTQEQVASNVSVKIGGVTLTGVLMETPDVSKLNPGEFAYSPVKDSSGDYTNASVTIPSLSLLDTTSYPNLNVEIVVTALEKPTPNNSSSSSKGKHHVTCEEYMNSNDWTWSEATQKCVIKVKVSDGYVVPNTADKSN